MNEKKSLPTLPRGWLWTTIEEISHPPQYGWTTSASKTGEIKLLRTTDITSGRIDWKNVPYCKKTPDDIEKYVLHEGEVVISRAGSVGYSHLIEKPKKAVFASYLIRFKPLINPKYFSYFLKSPFYWRSISKKKLGIAVPNVNATKLKQIFFPLAPQSEQEKIVEKIGELLTKLDAGVEDLQRIKKKLDAYRKSILKKVFTLNCEYKNLGELFNTTSGGTPSRKHEEYYTGNIPWLKSGEIRDNKNIIDSEEHINENALNNSSAKIFPINTVLIALYGATIGKIGIIKKEMTTNQAICGIKPNNQFIPEFVFYYLLFKRQNLINQGKGGAQPNISQGIIKATLFPNISKEQQKLIIDYIELYFSLIDNLEALIDNSLTKKEQLKKSILKNAFEGKLIPQDPSNEPAEMLLKITKNKNQKYEQKRLT